MKIIYRKSDLLIVGSVSPPHSENVELLNLTRSELGGVVGDYDITAAVPPKSATQMYQVNAGGIVAIITDPAIAKRRADRLTAQSKLKTLGLTADELTALGL